MSFRAEGRGRRASLDSFFTLIKDGIVPHALLFYEEDMFMDYFVADVR